MPLRTAATGGGPAAGLIADGKGNLYGTTEFGGAANDGVVFRLSPGGTETALHTFTGGNDGSGPSGLIADSSGNLYGTTTYGGAFRCGDEFSQQCGVVFKLSPSGTLTVLHSFMFLGGDGNSPFAGLIADGSGNLYGTTLDGGASASMFQLGCGTVFKVTPGGTETVLHSFTGGPSDGANPRAGLIADSSGNLYGTTEFGGASGPGCAVGVGCGVVFKLSPGGTETVLHSFTGGSDGGGPAAGLIADSSGNLYGTTGGGGASNAGVVFKLSPGGTETVLYSFKGGSDGSGPSGVITDSSGNLYGTTAFGGASGQGVVFKLTGTGFVPAVQFASFSSSVSVDFGKTANMDSFEIQSSFTLGGTSKGINPPDESVTLKVGTLALAVPPGSFTGTVTSSAFGPFKFAGTISGVTLNAAIAPTGAKRFSFQAGAHNASLTRTKNPVPVTLIIGGNNGATSVTATIK